MCVCGIEVRSGVTVENPKVNTTVHHFHIVMKIQQELSHVMLMFFWKLWLDEMLMILASCVLTLFGFPNCMRSGCFMEISTTDMTLLLVLIVVQK